jgi:type I restriction enzyme, S subunit
MTVDSSVAKAMLRVSGNIGNLPEAWSWGRLEDLCRGVYDCPHSTPKLTATGPYVVRTQDILSGVFISASAGRVSEETYRERVARAVPRRGDLLYSREGTYFGIAAEVPEEMKVCLGQRMVLIRPDETVLEFRFLRYWLNSPIMAAYIHGFRDGSVAERLNLPTIRSLPVLVPSLSEQSAIAEVLSALDDKIGVNNRIGGVAQALGDACFVGMARTSTSRRSMLAELATEKILTFGDGYRTKRSEHGQPGVPILRVAEVLNGRIEPEFVDFVADGYRSAMGGKISQAGDVILTTKGTVGRVAAITAKDPLFVYSPQLCYFRVLAGSSLSSSYMYFWLRSADFWQQAETRKSQTDMADYLSLTDIRKLTIPTPTAESNLQWAPTLSSLLAQISACREENRALAELRDTLLPKLMSGQIRVRDAEKVVGDVT